MRSWWKRLITVDLILWLVPLPGLSTALLLFRNPTVNDFGWSVLTTYPATESARSIVIWSISVTLAGAIILAIATGRVRAFFCGASAFLMVVIVAVWIRSHFYRDYFVLGLRPEREMYKYPYFASDSGGMAFGYYSARSAPGEDTFGHRTRKPTGEYPVLLGEVASNTMRLGRSGFAILTRPDRDATIWLELDGRFVAAPYWFLAFITAIAPAVWLRRTMRSRRRKRRGLCMVCGYDLRASAERCPECGTAVGGQ